MDNQSYRPARDVAADAERLRGLHVAGKPLILANIWDPATARLVASTGMPAVATTSAGVAAANGYEDHGKLPSEVAFSALRNISAAVQVPVTADIEDGYGLTEKELATCLAEAGACGLNIEDTNHKTGVMIDTEEQADRIAAIKEAGQSFGFNLVINARIDVYSHKRSTEEGLRRAQKYLSAGADCIFPIFLSDIAILREYVALGPTNVLWHPRTPEPAEFVSVGVSRISVGPVLFQLMLRKLKSTTDALLCLDGKAFLN